MSRLAVLGLLALPACSSTRGNEPFERLYAEAPGNSEARLLFAGDRILSAAIPVAGPGSIPVAARTMLRAIVPDGETLFQGREWGPAGEGYRVDKRYRDGLVDHVRSVLVAADGRVLERSHSVPLPEVPQQVLATALRLGPFVDEAQIVSDGERERHWVLLVRDRSGRQFVNRIGLHGQDLGHWRRLSARVDT